MVDTVFSTETRKFFVVVVPSAKVNVHALHVHSEVIRSPVRLLANTTSVLALSTLVDVTTTDVAPIARSISIASRLTLRRGS